MKWHSGILVLMLIIMMGGCSSSTDSGAPATADLGNTSAVIGALFSSGSGGALIVSKATLSAIAQKIKNEAGPATCLLFSGQDEGGEANVTSVASGTAGTYGASSNAITVAAEDFCETDDSGDGPDGKGQFGSFSLTGSKTATCTSSGSVEMTAGSGIFRHNLSDGYYPQIYGTFTIDGQEVDCSIDLDEDEEVVSATCSDSVGDAITLDSDEECSID